MTSTALAASVRPGLARKVGIHREIHREPTGRVRLGLVLVLLEGFLKRTRSSPAVRASLFESLLVKIVGPCRNEPSHTTAAPPGPDNPHRLSAVLLAVCDGVGRWIGWQALQGNQRDVPGSPSLVPRLTPRIKVLLSTLHASPPSTCDSPATRLPTGTRLESTASPVYPSSVLPYPSRTRVSNTPFPSLGPASGAHHPLVLPPSYDPIRHGRPRNLGSTHTQRRTRSTQTRHTNSRPSIAVDSWVCLLQPFCVIAPSRRLGATDRHLARIRHPTHPHPTTCLSPPKSGPTPPQAARPRTLCLRQPRFWI